MMERDLQIRTCASCRLSPLSLTASLDGSGCVPWCLRGAFVMSLVGAMAHASLVHAALPRLDRLELAMSALALLDMGQLMAKISAQEQGMPLRVCWLDAITHQNVRHFCAAVVIAAKACDGSVAWSQLQERILEERFGRLRAQFATAQMSVAEAWRASARLMLQDVRRWEGRPEDHARYVQSTPGVSDEQYTKTAAKAVNTAARLCSMVSAHSEAAVLQMYKELAAPENCDMDEARTWKPR